MFKQCRNCQKWQADDSFDIRIETGRRRNVCKTCRLDQIRTWANHNRAAVNANQVRYNRTLVGRANLLFNGARGRARNRNQAFTLTVEHVLAGLRLGHCVKTHYPFDFDTHGKAKTSPFAPSIDKIDPHGIYEPDNVQYVCWWYNMAKQQWSNEILLAMCHRVVSFNK